jgi:hypothetical protein
VEESKKKWKSQRRNGRVEGEMEESKEKRRNQQVKGEKLS